MIVQLNDLLKDAQNKKYAVGAFNCPNLESIHAVIDAAEKYNSPVILQHAQAHDEIIDMEEVVELYKFYGNRASVPVAIHLDHGTSMQKCIKAIRLGFGSIMFDASAEDYKTNLEQTKNITQIAHAAGVNVEAELGHVFTSSVSNGEVGDTVDNSEDYENLDDIYTDPEKAYEFVKFTNVDCLAIAFGTTHGVYLKEPKLDLNRIIKIRDKVNIPLVMHGGSGVSEADYKIAIDNGICKINYFTYMNTAGANEVKRYLSADRNITFFDDISSKAKHGMQQNVENAIKVFIKY